MGTLSATAWYDNLGSFKDDAPWQIRHAQRLYQSIYFGCSDFWRNKPRLAHWIQTRILPWIAALHDRVIWRLVSFLLQMVTLIRLRARPSRSVLKDSPSNAI